MQEQESGLRPIPSSKLRALEEATAAYEAAATPEVAQYLMARGISPEAASSARLGVVADPRPGHERCEGWLSIPYLGTQGQVVSIRFRCMEQHDHREHRHGKYMTVSGDRPRLYGVADLMLGSRWVALTEGELDRIILKQLGIPAVVGVPGAQSWKRHHSRLLQGFEQVVIFGDPDEAGAEMVNTISKSLRQAVAVKLPLDVNDTYLTYGPEAIETALNQVLSPELREEQE